MIMRYSKLLSSTVYFLLTSALVEAFSATTTTNKQTRLVFPGGGVFFNWQGGIITYLRENNYDLSNASFLGSSAGSLTAALAATGVDFHEATSLALEMAQKYDVWDRPDGLKGVIGPLVEEWLDELIPEALDVPEDKLSILVTPVPLLWEKETITTFNNRQELMDCCLASIHLPWFSDGGLWKTYRGKPYIDGNFLSTGKHYLRRPTRSGRAKGAKTKTIVLNWQKDPSLKDKSEDDLVATLTPEAVWDLVELGKQYAETMEARGRFKHMSKID